jgi:hypothetical protein
VVGPAAASGDDFWVVDANLPEETLTFSSAGGSERHASGRPFRLR